MKLVKMSLAAAVLLGASAFAIDNVKVSGDAKLFYGTNNAGSNSLFDKGNAAEALVPNGGQAGSYADTALRISATADLAKGISAGVTGYAVSTLGLENNLVSNTWTGAHKARVGNGSQFAEIAGGAEVDDASWIGEAWIAATAGKTTVKLGRMELDTPLAFTEKWSIVPNTFEAAVAINQDLPDTTLVGAWVGKDNSGKNELDFTATGIAKSTKYYGATLPAGYRVVATVGIDGGVVNPGGAFHTFGANGAYAVGAINNSFKPLTVQAWYYDVVDIADAYWLQGDINCQLVKGLTLGAQFADMSPKGSTEKVLKAADDALNTDYANDTQAYAFKVGYTVDKLKLAAAYSSVSNTGAVPVQNVAASGQSKLYTEAWWNYTYVGAVGSDSYMLSAEYDAGVAKLGAQFTSASVKASKEEQLDSFGDTKAVDMNEIALTVSKSFGPLDATLAYISTDADNQNAKATKDANYDGRRYDSVQAYLTLNF